MRAVPDPPRDIVRTLLARWLRQDPSGCVIWTGPLSGLKGRVGINRHRYGAQQLVWFMYHDKQPDHPMATTCGNRLCCRLDHLFERPRADTPPQPRHVVVVNRPFDALARGESRPPPISPQAQREAHIAQLEYEVAQAGRLAALHAELARRRVEPPSVQQPQLGLHLVAGAAVVPPAEGPAHAHPHQDPPYLRQHARAGSGHR